jgi:cyclophilin family peptidyl-prolyl cis-trans isomerase
MVVRQRSATMDGINGETILPLHDNRRSSLSDDDDDDVSTCSSRPPMLKTSASLCSSDSLPLWTPQSARRALHMELSNAHDHPLRSSSSVHNTHNSNINHGDVSTLVFTAIKRKHPLYVAVTVFCLVGLYLYATSHATLHSALGQVTRLTDQRRQVNIQFREVENDIRQLQRKLISLDQGTGWEEGRGILETSDPAGKESEIDEMMFLQEKLKEGNSQVGSLQRHLQATSRRDAITKYGAGVIRVELELEFPDSPDGPNTIVMEMAPLDLMPHSVYIFLEMVHAKLFDGCSFILNAMHVIKAAPLPYDGSSASAKVKAFTKRGLECVAFREYTPEFPHSQFTVGFAADGSPSFYINTQDNTDIHIGDPCFAKIVAGFDTVKRLESSPTRNGIWYRQRIGLKNALIL